MIVTKKLSHQEAYSMLLDHVISMVRVAEFPAGVVSFGPMPIEYQVHI